MSMRWRWWSTCGATPRSSGRSPPCAPRLPPSSRWRPSGGASSRARHRSATVRFRTSSAAPIAAGAAATGRARRRRRRVGSRSRRGGRRRPGLAPFVAPVAGRPQCPRTDLRTSRRHHQVRRQVAVAVRFGPASNRPVADRWFGCHSSKLWINGVSACWLHLVWRFVNFFFFEKFLPTETHNKNNRAD